MTNLVDMARALTPRHVCACGLAVHMVSGVWLDGGGSGACWSGQAHIGRVWVAPSPLLRNLDAS